MDYYNTMRTDFIHKAMYPEDPMRVDFIPKGPPQGTLTIKPKDRCAPRIISKIEGSAVEEGCKVFFEGIVDAKPQPKFNWYFNDEPIFPGQTGFEDAEVHDSRRMSTLILTYAREHHMGKYTLVTSNQLGTVECSCDLIVRKKQFPPVFWQRLYNVGDEGSRRFVGGVEVGGWPVPAVFWYKVAEDGTEVEVTSKTHTENYNGNPNKYVPSSKVEVREIDAIRHCIVFHEVSSGDSGTYRVRAVNCLGEAECEAELNFDEFGETGSGELYLPQLWRDKRKVTWRDMDVYDQRKKPFTNVDDPSLTPEELAEMKMKSGMVPLSRITEYFASLPDYRPTDRFRDLERMPYKPGVDEHDYRADRKGAPHKCFPGKFQRGNIVHNGYVSDSSGRILPWWFNKSDPHAVDATGWCWKAVHPELYIPNIPDTGRGGAKTPEGPLIWETTEHLVSVVKMLRSMGCRMEEVKMIESAKKPSSSQPVLAPINVNNNKSFASEKTEEKSWVKSETSENIQQEQQKGSKVKKFSYTGGVQEAEEYSKSVSTEVVSKTSNVRKTWEEKLEKNVSAQQTNATDFTTQFLTTQETSSSQMNSGQMYQKQENLSFPELEQMTTQPPPALPPKTKIKHSPSRNIFSPTDSLENVGTGTASIKSVEFMPVKEKVKLIAAQQEELLRKEERTTKTSETHKTRGVRILPPSPVTVRKMSVEEELHHYDSDVTRSTPTIVFMETPPPRPELPDMPMYQDVKVTNGQSCAAATEGDYSTIDSGISHSVASYQQASSSQQNSSMQVASHEEMTSQQTSSFSEQQTYSSTSSYTTQKTSRAMVPGWSESPVMNIDEQKEKEEMLNKMGSEHGVDTALEQLIAETESLVSNDTLLFQQQEQRSEKVESSSCMTTEMTSIERSVPASLAANKPAVSPAEECRRSFEEAELEAMALETQSNASLSKQSSIVESTSVQSFVFQKEEKTESESSFRSRQPLRSSSTAFVRSPETFTHSQPPSCPTTPMSQRRRLRINQSPKPPAEEAESKPKYRDGTASPFQPGFYRPPPEETTSSNPIFKLIRRNNSRTNLAPKEAESPTNPTIRISQASISSKAYDGDSES